MIGLMQIVSVCKIELSALACARESQACLKGLRPDEEVVEG